MNRFHTELRFRDNFSVRFRNKIIAGYNIGCSRPYLAEEIFISTEEYLNTNRLYMGLDTKASDAVNLGSLYLLQSDRREGWIHKHIFELKIKAVM